MRLPRLTLIISGPGSYVFSVWLARAALEVVWLVWSQCLRVVHAQL